jgi:hypothetical protein
MNCHYSAQGDYKCTKPTKEGFGQTAAQKLQAKRAADAALAKQKADAIDKAQKAAAAAAQKIKDAQRAAALKVASDKRYR